MKNNWEDNIGQEISWGVNLTQEQTENLDNLILQEASKQQIFEVIFYYRKFVRGKQYARPFTYMDRKSGKARLECSDFKNVKEDNASYEFSANFTGIGDIE